MTRTSNSPRIGSVRGDDFLTVTITVVILCGCPGSTRTVAPEPNGAPEPIAVKSDSKPEPRDPVAVAIEVERFEFLAMEDGPFPNAAPPSWPRVVLSIENPEGDAAHEAEQLLGDDRGWELHDDPKAIGLPATPRVWMFAPTGVCEAKVGRAYTTAYEDGYLTLERGFRLEPCAETFAPVVYVGPAAPALRWRPAKSVFYEIVDDPNAWEHPTKATLIANGLVEWEPDAPPQDIYVRVREAGRVREIGYAHHWPHAEDCQEDQAIDLRLGSWDGETFTEFPAVNEFAGNSELIGVLDLDGEPAAVIADERYQLQLGLVKERTVSWTGLPTGDYHDEDVAYWGWSVLDGYCGP